MRAQSNILATTTFALVATLASSAVGYVLGCQTPSASATVSGSPAPRAAEPPQTRARPTASPAINQKLPARVGHCAQTTIAEIGSRLQDGDGGTVPESGSAVKYANGGYQVSYEVLPGVTASLVGDPIKLCLTEIPKDCPADDDRGRSYRATNLRTGQSWEAPDSEHECGGA